MSLYITPKKINGFEMYAVMLGETVLGSAWSMNGARHLANVLINNIRN